MRWKAIVSCLLLLLCTDHRAIAQRGIANVSMSQLAQTLSMEFSTIIRSGIGADQLVQAFEGPSIFGGHETATDGDVESWINQANAQQFHDSIIEVFDIAFSQDSTEVDSSIMFPEDFSEECCDITNFAQIDKCCHQCQSQSDSVKTYLTNVGGVLTKNVTNLLAQFGVQVRFEFAHQSGALIEIPAINIGAVGNCVTRNPTTENWYTVTLTSGAVMQSDRVAGKDALVISRASSKDGSVVVARATIFMVELFKYLNEKLEDRPSSYWFAINTQEDIFYHPHQPIDDRLTIRQLEQDVVFNSVRMAMTRLDSGADSGSKTHLLSLGPTVAHGYNQRVLQSTYIYRPIIRDETGNLSVCVILAEEDRNVSYIVATNPENILGTDTSREPFYHCSFATGATNHEACSYYCQFASRDALSAYLTNPSVPPNDDSDVTASVNLYLGGGSRPQWVQMGVATEAARASVLLNSVWLSNNNDINEAVSWRYVAFPSGLLLHHPAVKSDQNLRLEHLPWYNRALAHPGLITLSPATPDIRGSGLIYSVSKAIYRPTSDGNIANRVGGPPLAVIAGDLSLASLHTFINTMEPLCAERDYNCFLMDSAGILIYHPRFLSEIPREPVHIGFYHRRFYNDLILEPLLVKKNRCNDYTKTVNVTERSFTMFSVTFTAVLEQLTSCLNYQFTLVPGTNVYFAITHGPRCDPFFCLCRPSPLLDCTSCPNNRISSTQCECPCSCQLFPDRAVSNLRQCPSGPTEQPPRYIFQTSDQRSLPLCYNQQCDEINDENDCNLMRECAWCFSQCTRLEDCCEDNRTALLPTCRRSSCRGVSDGDDDDVSSGAIAGAVVGIIFVVLLIGCLVLVLVWYNFIRKEDPNAPKAENEFDFSKSRSSSDNQSQEPLSKKGGIKTDSKIEERDSNGATIVTPDTIHLNNPLYNDNSNNDNPKKSPGEKNINGSTNKVNQTEATEATETSL
ncbi:VWFA and cache domain-containing protein 1-like [Dysidea avara]|uniref:VWFA and cache domain-containing protein 1-like n=1 Tax=Dysidea avara TaxID=196820 RepID=UPI0033174E1F